MTTLVGLLRRHQQQTSVAAEESARRLKQLDELRQQLEQTKRQLRAVREDKPSARGMQAAAVGVSGETTFVCVLSQSKSSGSLFPQERR